jgi:hypothetical protein
MLVVTSVQRTAKLLRYRCGSKLRVSVEGSAKRETNHYILQRSTAFFPTLVNSKCMTADFISAA